MAAVAFGPLEYSSIAHGLLRSTASEIQCSLWHQRILRRSGDGDSTVQSPLNAGWLLRRRMSAMSCSTNAVFSDAAISAREK